MKLCYLAAANSIHSVRWIKYFSDKGYEIIWVSLAPAMDEAKELIKKTKYFEIKPSPLSDINGSFAIFHLSSAIQQLKKILEETKPDLMHIHSVGTYGLLGALTGFKPIVMTPWGTDILLPSFLKRLLLKFTLRQAQLLTCDGDNTTQALIDFGVAPEKIKMIRFGTDIEKFKPLQENRNQRIENRTIKIISLRTLIPIYDVETLIKAAAIVVKATPEVKFIIAGDGDQKEHLIPLSKNLGLSPQHIEFIGKYRNENLPKMLNEVDIYVSTSLSDSGLSASTAEAMASGLPVIVSDSGDNRQWVDDNKGGFVIPLKSPEILAEKIIYLLKNKAFLKSFGEYNRKIIEEKNNYYREMGKLEKLYEEIIKTN